MADLKQKTIKKIIVIACSLIFVISLFQSIIWFLRVGHMKEFIESGLFPEKYADSTMAYIYKHLAFYIVLLSISLVTLIIMKKKHRSSAKQQ